MTTEHITHDDMRADADRAINGAGASLFMLGNHVLSLLAENEALRAALTKIIDGFYVDATPDGMDSGTWQMLHSAAELLKGISQ